MASMRRLLSCRREKNRFRRAVLHGLEGCPPESRRRSPDQAREAGLKTRGSQGEVAQRRSLRPRVKHGKVGEAVIPYRGADSGPRKLRTQHGFAVRLTL